MRTDEMCKLKPNTDACTNEIQKGTVTTGCGGCPVSNGQSPVCLSTHPNALAKRKNSATDNALSAKIKAKKN